MAKLDNEHNQLLISWRRFQENLPLDARLRFQQRPQTLQDVLDVVESAELEWSKKRQGFWEKTKRSFHRFCKTLDAHSTMLEVLPTQSHYVSLFYGSLQSVIKASVNYQKIAEGLSLALVEINDAAATCAKEFELFPSVKMKRSIAQLYTLIFCFFGDVMKWYTEKSIKRVLHSLNDDFYTVFERQLTDIKLHSARINREGEYAARVETRINRLRLSGVDEKTSMLVDEARNVRYGLQGMERRSAEEHYETRQLLFQIELEKREKERLDREWKERIEGMLTSLLPLGSQAVDFLTYQARLQQEGLADLTRQLQLNHPTSEEPGVPGAFNIQTLGMTRSDVQFNSRHLASFFNPSAALIPIDPASTVYAEEIAIMSLREWTASPASAILAITGPYQDGEVTSETLIAAYYAALARRADIPVISHFCTLQMEKPARGRTREELALVGLVYSLIRQLVDLVPPALEDGSKFPEDRFKKLDGTTRTWDEAIAILRDLLEMSPSVLICVIDGIQWIDDLSTESAMKKLFSLLRHYVEPGEGTQRRVCKILFTTAGESRALFTALTDREIVLTEHTHTTRAPGEEMPGRLALPAVISS